MQILRFTDVDADNLHFFVDATTNSERTSSFRLGLFGFGASELLREDNAASGEEGVGNYGKWDQFHPFLFHFRIITRPLDASYDLH